MRGRRGGESQASPGAGAEAETQSGHPGAEIARREKSRAGPWRAVPRSLGCAAQHALPGSLESKSKSAPEECEEEVGNSLLRGGDRSPPGACVLGI